MEQIMTLQCAKSAYLDEAVSVLGNTPAVREAARHAILKICQLADDAIDLFDQYSGPNDRLVDLVKTASEAVEHICDRFSPYDLHSHGMQLLRAAMAHDDTRLSKDLRRSMNEDFELGYLAHREGLAIINDQSDAWKEGYRASEQDARDREAA